MKGKRQREGSGDAGQFKGSQCQVLMCLFSSSGVPGNEEKRGKKGP